MVLLSAFVQALDDPPPKGEMFILKTKKETSKKEPREGLDGLTQGTL